MPVPDPGTSVPTSPLRLRLTIEPSQRVQGVVGLEGGEADTPFRGWLELMAAISDLQGGAKGSPFSVMQPRP